MSLWQWLKTAAGNANADPSINWAEGQSPSSVNDSARAMMARIAEWRDDMSGVLNDGGSASAYTLTSNQGFPTTPNDGQVICFKPANTNNLGVTLQVDSGGAFAIQSSVGVGVGAGVLIAGSPYAAVFRAASNVWLLRGYYSSPTTIPIGGMIPYSASTSAPNSNFVLASGQAISRTTYSAYFALVGTGYGGGDGVTTFNVPDTRGRFICGLDINLGSGLANRITAANGNFNTNALGAVGGLEYHVLTNAELPSHSHANSLNDPGHAHNYSSPGPTLHQDGSNLFDVLVGTQTLTTATAFTGMTINNAAAGGGGLHPIVNPAIVMTMLLRVF